jgi:hypothetical protein
VPFVLVNVLGFPPRILEGPFRLDNFRYRTTVGLSDLRPIESVPLGEFGALVHYDPWWTLRGVSGVQRAWIDAVIATNIAHPFRYAGRKLQVRDLVFSIRLDRLVEIDARGGLFRSVTLHPGDVDVLALRAAPRAEPTPQIAGRAKAL